MINKYNLSLFIFRRDLRLEDNTGLIEALNYSKKVIPCFILDPRQIGPENKYRSLQSIDFMINSLQDLSLQLKKRTGKLFFFHGISEKIVAQIYKEIMIDAVFINRDYTPFSRLRDKNISDFCAQNNIGINIYHDCLINEPEDILTVNKKPFSIFTPFYKKSLLYVVNEPHVNNFHNYFSGEIKISQDQDYLLYKMALDQKNTGSLKGGTTTAVKLLEDLTLLYNYKETRDIPSINSSLLSPHNKFGTVSIRQVFHSIKKTLGKDHLLLKQLYWRDFFTHMAFHYPKVFGNPFNNKYQSLEWSDDQIMFEKWCNGMTGFPIVDAGMRQLNETGFMHNRARLIVGSFLVKDLHINWLWGEKYFAQKLIDFDPAVNNGNWQWVASTGSDSTPYFRIFNPWLQQKKFDPSCIYIKTWIPELRDVPAQQIHNWEIGYNKNYGYPPPIINHKKEADITKKFYRFAIDHYNRPL